MADTLLDRGGGALRRDTPVAAVDRGAFRLDIQGLRAIAVIAVVLFHIWPRLVPGGFIGVDVFFVISGYLITGMLTRELHETGRISLLKFYARRVKRLLPAASFVLIVVALATPLLPPSRWQETAVEVIASALYAENWRLAWLAVDYLGSENAASPVQHYWSLSIEEQFYIVWPLIMIGAAAFSRRFGKRRPAIVVPLAAIVIMSFAASVWLTVVSRESAYFVTHTRVWELGVGALLALIGLPQLSQGLCEAMRASGLAAILASAACFSSATAFPGYAALLPTLGCALVIGAGQGATGWSLCRVLALRPAQYLGDISYAVYLWHWPAIVFAGAYVSGDIGVPLGLGVIAASITLADLTKRTIEDPLRYLRFSSMRALGLGAALIGGTVFSATIVYEYVALRVIRSYENAASYPGARAFLDNAPVPQVDDIIPPLALLRKDKPDAYRLDCHLSSEASDLNPCRFGTEGGTRVVLLGDSHAASWEPALIELANANGWRVEAHTKSACSVLKKTVLDKDRPYRECRDWGEKVLGALRRSPPNLVIMTSKRYYRFADEGAGSQREQLGAAIADVWRDLLASGIKVVALRDTPALGFDPDKCLSLNAHCHAEEAKIFDGDDPIVLAHRLVPEVPLIDMTDALCRGGICPMVIGNIVVWRDRHHLTASFARTTATELGKRLDAAVGPMPR